MSPALRAASSLELGAVQVVSSAWYDSSMGPPEIAPIPYVPLDVQVRVGLGGGWEAGMRPLVYPVGGDVKFAILDARRHASPISIAADLDFG